MRFIIFHLFIFLSCFGSAQSGLKFKPVFGQEAVKLEERIELDSVWTEISALRFYVSELKIYYGGSIWNAPQKHLLMDMEDPSSFNIDGLPPHADSISFFFGIDSLTNVSGILDGALDPINGMYWSWNSGYINFKLEGKGSRSINKDKGFEFHLGGYLPPYQTVQLVMLYPVSEGDIVVRIDLQTFLEMIDWNAEPNIMIPGPQAYRISKQLPSLFSIGQ